ncbi:flavin-containing monooxygenase [Puniceibacterium confluentis]|uniref:flavin-containing monooxygenase n=1 Tax=Puniceibacterium confluentis TaxID=1958944 RepID=UPI0011B58C46|nr:NAD(P)/FAD-dependent oxidoreductase [Puniceibacterium confluentis]
MPTEYINTLVVGGGQAGLAMSEHLSSNGIDHLVLERNRIAERWRVERWSSLVANGPAWHDRFPSKEFADCGPDDFPTKDSVVAYLEEFAEEKKVPIRCGVKVSKVTKAADGGGFIVATSDGQIHARNIVAATGPFQIPAIPPVVPAHEGLTQIHSTAYHRPEDLPDGGVLVVGAGSSGSQIAEELRASGRDVYLSVGAHDRPPRRYRGKDFVWWLGVLGKWQMTSPPEGAEHVTIAVSGANGGQTVDFRRFAGNGITLLGMTEAYRDGTLTFAADLARNIAQGDANYLSVLDEADAYVAREGIDLPLDPTARDIGPDPACVRDPILELDLAAKGIKTIIWATGFTQDFSWLDVDAFDAVGKPQHENGVSSEPGVYFLGLPWLSMRGSAFIWGVWVDAKNLATHIAQSGRHGA